MPYSSLADFLELIEQTDELVRIDDLIDPNELLCAVLPPGKSVLLSHLQGCRFPVAGPLMIDPARVGRAIGVADLEEAALRIEKWGRENAFDCGSGPSDWTKEVTQAPVQQVVRLASDLDESVLPRQISGVTLFTVDPDSGRRFGAAVELEVDSPTRLVLRWTAEVGVTPIRDRYAEWQRPMPVAICVGGDPAIRLAGEAPAPCPVDPCVLGAVLRGRPVEVVACRTYDKLAVPADTDLVIEGYLSDGMIEVHAVTHRINPVLPFAVPEERAVVRRTLLQAMVPWWRAEVPGLADLALPEWGVEDSVLVGSVEKAYVEQAEQIADALACHPVWKSDRTVILVDRPVKLTDESAVLAALLRHVDFGRKTLLALDKSQTTQ